MLADLLSRGKPIRFAHSHSVAKNNSPLRTTNMTVQSKWDCSGTNRYGQEAWYSRPFIKPAKSAAGAPSNVADRSDRGADAVLRTALGLRQLLTLAGGVARQNRNGLPTFRNTLQQCDCSKQQEKTRNDNRAIRLALGLLENLCVLFRLGQPSSP
jgi:hypothetical protein